MLLLLLPSPLAAQESARRLSLTPAEDLALSPAERVFARRSCSEFRLLPVLTEAAECSTHGHERMTADDLAGGGDASPVQRELPFRAKEPQKLLAAGVAVADVALTAANSLLGYQRRSFHFNNEGFFGANTNDGGADKASHFTDYYIVSREFSMIFEILGFTETQAHWMGFGVATFGGLVNEISDGFTRHGFSYEDFVMDLLGAGTAAAVGMTRTDDLVGFRGSHLPGPTYSHDVYSADLKLAGVARRLGLNIGPLRYLLLSVTYASKGYRDRDPEVQLQRQVGFEIGLNLEQILNDVGVRRNTWWGYALHMVGDNVRFPYTAVGIRLDLNHGKWYGPNNGNY